jgi:hypothetical protein
MSVKRLPPRVILSGRRAIAGVLKGGGKFVGMHGEGCNCRRSDHGIAAVEKSLGGWVGRGGGAASFRCPCGRFPGGEGLSVRCARPTMPFIRAPPHHAPVRFSGERWHFGKTLRIDAGPSMVPVRGGRSPL